MRLRFIQNYILNTTCVSSDSQVEKKQTHIKLGKIIVVDEIIKQDDNNYSIVVKENEVALNVPSNIFEVIGTPKYQPAKTCCGGK